MRYVTLALILSLLLAPPALAAAMPSHINYQGVLRDAGGVPESGPFDMKFRLFDVANAGNELVIDEHLAAGTGAVIASGGLFSVALGSGSVADGSGPGVLTSFADAFAQYGEVWLEVQVGGETLTPRVSILASAYAINSSRFQGKTPDQFLDTSATPQEKTGRITASGGIDFGPGLFDDLDSSKVITLTGGGNADSLHTHSLVGQASNANLLDSIDSSQFLRSDTDDTYTSGTLTLAPGTVLSAKGQVRLDGSLFMDGDGPDGTQALYFFDQGSTIGEAFAWDETLDKFTLSNTLRLQNGSSLEVTGDSVGINSDGPDATQSIYFYDHGEPLGQSLAWDDTGFRFAFSSGARFEGALSTAGNVNIGGGSVTMGTAGPDQNQILGFYDAGIVGNEFLMWENTADRFRLSNDLQLLGALEVSGASVTLGSQGAETNQSIYVYEDGSQTGESITWDDAQDRFEISDELATSGTIRAGSTTTSSVTYNTIGSGTPLSGDMTTSSDLLVTSDLEVGDQLYLGGDESVKWNAADTRFYFTNSVQIGDTIGENAIVGGNRIYLGNGAPTNIPSKFLEYSLGRFTLNDDLDVVGTVSANIKNFVQNHPYDPSLEIVYTTLEGPEASTFTRGSARLKDGVARVPLNESFAWVTNPDLGLTASLTPRGGAANLYVEKISTTELVVRAAPGAVPDAAFDYLVLGLRVGMEEAPVVRPRQRDARLPDPANLKASIAGRPDLARFTPLARHSSDAHEAFGIEASDLSKGEALRNAIGTDPEVASSVELSRASRAELSADRIPVPVATNKAQAPASVRDEEDAAVDVTTRPSRPNARGFDAFSPVVGGVAEGDVLILDRAGLALRRSEVALDPTVVGIATGAPTAATDGTLIVPFAVFGIVTCKVDAANGSVLAGDLLVTSPNPGHAMRAISPQSGTVVGKALEPLASGTGTIRVLVVLR